MKSLHFEACGTFRVTPEALWPLVSDTARMNRAIGSPPVVHTITPVAGGGSRLEGEIRLGGLPLARYVEHPFRWEAPRGFVVVREFQGSPLVRVRAGVQLTPVGDGTEVVVYGNFVPRTALGAILARLLGPRSVDNTIRQCRSFERYLLGESDQPHPQLVRLSRLPWLASRSAASGSDTHGDPLIARGLSREAVELLRRHLAEAPDEDVAGMGPFELADAWGLDRHETLGLFLHATAAGLVTMRWDVLCPNCRVSKARAGTLRDLAARTHCDTCNISFDAAFDRSVEVRFSVAPAIRTVLTDEYCVGGPMNTPHVLAQTVVPPGGMERLHVQLEAGPYRLRPRGSRGRLMLTASDLPSEQPGQGAAEATLTATVHLGAVEPFVADVPTGALVLDLVNATDHEQVVLLEGSLWPDTVVTAATACAHPWFRDLFPQEMPAPGARLGIESLVFLAVEAPVLESPAGGTGGAEPPLPPGRGLDPELDSDRRRSAGGGGVGRWCHAPGHLPVGNGCRGCRSAHPARLP